MSCYSTIINTNNAGRRGQLEEWLKDHRFFIGSDKSDVKVIINDDLSVSLKTDLNDMDFKGGDFIFPEIAISEIPLYGIKELKYFRKVTFINISEKDSSKLPRKYICVPNIVFEYCKIPEIYIESVKKQVKKNIFDKDTFSIETKQCILV